MSSPHTYTIFPNFHTPCQHTATQHASSVITTLSLHTQLSTDYQTHSLRYLDTLSVDIERAGVGVLHCQEGHKLQDGGRLAN